MRGLICLGLIAVMLFSSGCASTQKTKRIEELETQVAELTQAMKEKDEQLQSSQELFEELQNELDKYKTQLESSEEVEESLK